MLRGVRSWPARYGVAALAVAVALVLQALLIPLFGGDPNASPFMAFFAAVIVAAWFGGLGAGLLAVGLSALLSWYFFLTPQFSLALGSFGQALRLLVFAAEGALISLLLEAMHNARGRAEESALRARENEEGLRRSEQRHRFLAASSVELSSSLDYRATLSAVARLAVPTLADWCAVDVVAEDGWLERLAVEHPDPEKVSLAYELQERYPTDPTTEVGVHQVLRTGEAEMVPEIPRELLDQAAQDDEHREIIRELGLRSYMIVPLIARGKTLGAISFVTAESGRVYGEADLGLAEELAGRAALAVDNARLYGEAQTQIEERERAEEAMREIRETERSRMARELHDGVLQDLAYAATAIEVTRVKAQGTGLEEELGWAIETVRRAVGDLREAVYDLHAYSHHDQSARQLLVSLVERNRSRAPGMTIALTVGEEVFDEISEREGMELLRVVQEALTNIRRHSGARNVHVDLTAVQDHVVVEVSDDGRGFDPETPHGIGLRSMRERARALGGRLEVDSAPGKGTRVQLRIRAKI